MNCTDFISGLKGTAIAAAFGVTMLVAPEQVVAQSTEVTIEQVQPGRSGTNTGNYQDTTGAGDDSGDYVPTELITSGARMTVGSANLSSINQSGNSNFASVTINGVGNLTIQDQRGAFNNSELDVVGSSNRVLVEQRGVGLQSDINLTGAEGKTVVHLQRGRSSSRTVEPIDIGNQSAPVVFVIDTPRGRRVVTR